ncbi:MAG: flagellar brake protein [Candidimonas sp.]|nr:MAG: flagellar brake protein [Candidimonas sp.]
MHVVSRGLSITTNDPTLITARPAIASLLRTLQEGKAPVNIVIRGSSLAAITTILSVEDAYDAFVVDVARDDQLNRCAIDADDIRFEAAINGIELHFSSAFASPCEIDRRPALRLALPRSLRRMQRRESYRVDVPASNPATCTLATAQPSGSTARGSAGRNRPGEPITLNVQDISVGGVSLVDDRKRLSITRANTLPGCHIVLPEAGSITATLRVVRVADLTLENGKAIRQLGCAFVNLPGSMAVTVQRYISLVEHRLNTKRLGTD